MDNEQSHYPHVEAGERYAVDIIEGRIPACKWVRLACERHFRDKGRSADSDWPYEFEPKKAEDVAVFMELFPHTKGKWAAASEPFVLQPWQCFLVFCIFGWVKKDGGKRRFRRAMLIVPRKNGKSDIAGRIGLYCFAADGEFGAEVYSGATTESQAWEIFRPARLMAERTEPFQDHYGVEVMKSNLHKPSDGSRFEPVIGKPGDGASPSCALVDEYHEHADDTLLDTMETGMGAREQPLALIVTTAGDNLSGPCYALQKDLEKILEGTVKDESFWGIVYTIDSEDEENWATEEALRKANPNYGVSVGSEFLLGKLSEALRNARKQGTFKTKHQNVWVGARNAFFNIKSWQNCVTKIVDAATGQERPIRPTDCKGYPLFMGVDLASTIDIAAVWMLFRLPDGRYAGFGRFYIPEARIEDGANEHYRGWKLEGRLIVTEGDMIDYDTIENDVKQIHSDFGITQLAYDPAYAQMLTQHLMAEGIDCVEVRPTVMNFSQPMKTIDGLILSGKVQHDGDPVMTWMLSNVVAKTDAKDNVYPNKERVEAKIDGPVAMIMAANRALVYVAPEPSVYETRGVQRL